MLYVSSDDSSNDESDYFDINNGDSDDNRDIPITSESQLTWFTTWQIVTVINY